MKQGGGDITRSERRGGKGENRVTGGEARKVRGPAEGNGRGNREERASKNRQKPGREPQKRHAWLV